MLNIYLVIASNYTQFDSGSITSASIIPNERLCSSCSDSIQRKWAANTIQYYIVNNTYEVAGDRQC